MKITKQELLNTVLYIVDKIAELDIIWLITGSTNLILRDIDITPKDIDIITTKDGAKKIYSIFNEFGVKEVNYSSTDKYRSYFGIVEINGIRIEIMAELEYNVNNKWIKSSSLENLTKIEFKGKLIPVNPLKNELDFYKLMERKNDPEKILKIQNKLKE